MTYVDDFGVVWRSKPRYHLMADSVAELHRFAAACGINRCWFHHTRGYPHYDITDVQRLVAAARGARLVTARDLVLIANELRH